MFALLADNQLRPEIPSQRQFSVIQSGRLANHEFHHLDEFLYLADQKRQLA
jgi:hypothetical protein